MPLWILAPGHQEMKLRPGWTTFSACEVMGVPLHVTWHCSYVRDIRQASLSPSPTVSFSHCHAVRATFCSFVCVKKCHSRHFSLERQIFMLWRITLPQSTHHLEEGSPATNLIQWVHRMSRAVQKYVSTARVQNFNHLRLPSSMERTAAVMFYMLFLVRGACWQYFSPIR